MEYLLFRKVKTGTLILIWVAMGLYLEISGPTLIDLKLLFNTSYEAMSRSVSARGAGMFLGAVIGGLFVDVAGRWKDLIITVSHVLAATVVLLMPFVHNLTLLWFFFFVMGVAAGAVNVAGQRIILEMWQEKTPAPMHAMHMGFGIGAVLAPLISNPFLAILSPDENPGGNTTANHTEASVTQAYHVIKESRVEYAYLIIGILTTVLSIPFYSMICLTCRNKSYHQLDEGQRETPMPKSLKAMLNPATYANGSMKYGIFVYIIVFLYFFSLVGGEQLFGNFIRTFSVDQLKFPRNVASYLDTTFWGCFTVGRFLGAVLSHKFSLTVIFPAYALLNLLAVTFLDIFSVSSSAVLWVFTCMVGLLIAPLYPSGMSFTNTQVEVGGVVLTLAIIAGGLGDWCYIWFAGHMYDVMGPRAVLFAMQISASCVFAIVIVFLIVGHYHGNRFTIYRQLETDSLSSQSDQRLSEATPIQMSSPEMNAE